MWRRMLVGGTALVTAVVLSSCDVAETPGRDGGPATTPAPAEQAVSYCDVVDPEDVTRVAEELDLPGLDGEQLRLATWRVAAGAELVEHCGFGTTIQGGVVRLEARPAGVPDDFEVPEEAEPIPELGADAYFHDQEVIFSLAAPVGDSYLTLEVSGPADPSDDPVPGGAAEQALRDLLATVDERQLPATLAGLLAGEDCADLEDAVTSALDGTLDFSRYIELEGSFTCELSSSESGRGVAVGRWLDAAERLGSIATSGVGRELSGVEDAWLIPHISVVYAFDGPDVIRLDVRGGSAEEELNTAVEELAAEVVPMLTAGD